MFFWEIKKLRMFGNIVFLYLLMYVPPTLRQVHDEKITNLCDEFLHIDETPEAHITKLCVSHQCRRKSVTCIARILEQNEEIYVGIYKNDAIHQRNSIHAEIFMTVDTVLRQHLKENRQLIMYLTFQPCHFSGGHRRQSHKSCTEHLIQFYLKNLKPLNMSLIIKIGYIYRAHWTMEPQYYSMIQNAIVGLKMLLQYFKIEVIGDGDMEFLLKCSDEKVQKKWNNGDYLELMRKRKSLESFMTQFIESNGLDETSI